MAIISDPDTFSSFLGFAFGRFSFLANFALPTRDYSSVGLERLLHTQEVSSSNLLSPTTDSEALTAM